jgi:hypothetical protein
VGLAIRKTTAIRPNGRWAIGYLVTMLLLSACSGGTERKPPAEGRTAGAAGAARPVELTGAADNISDPEIGLDGEGTIHVVWVEGLTSEAKIVHRFLAHGQEWSAPQTLTEGYQYNGAPTLVAKPDGQLCVFWKATVPEADLYMRCWANGAWSPTQKAIEPQGLTATYAPGFASDGTPVAVYEIPPDLVGFAGDSLTPDRVTAGRPAFAVDASGGYHTVWLQFAGQTNELGGLVYRHSVDGGATWEKPRLLNDPNDLDFSSALVADKQGGLHWVTVDGSYRHWTSTDGWSAIQVVDAGGLGDARLAADGDGRARIVRPGVEGVYLAQQRDDGTWTDLALIKATAGGPVAVSVLAVDGTGVNHIVWLTTSGNNPVLYYAALR